MFPFANSVETRSVVVVWYRPHSLGHTAKGNLRAVWNIQTYSEKFKYVVIVDNSEEDNANLAAEIKNAVYIANRRNEGIARALNQGCQRCLEVGSHFVLTMDQDAFFDEAQLEQYLDKIEKCALIDDHIKSFAIKPYRPDAETNKAYLHFLWKASRRLIRVIRSPVAYFRRDRGKIKGRASSEYVTKTLTSGNFIDLTTWAMLGGFDETLFIDEVDFDFCYRLQRSGFRIIRFNDCFMHHKLGEYQKTIFPRTALGRYNGVRVYYIVRNRLIMMERYPEFTSGYGKRLFDMFIGTCILSQKRVENWGHWRRAVKDAKENRTITSSSAGVS